MSSREIAERVGVSVSTVSRVLNNPDYRPSDKELRDKVWRAAIEMNYTPNEAARSLKTGKISSRVNYINILQTYEGGADRDPFLAELLRVLESEIHRSSCILSRLWTEPLFSSDRKCRSASAVQKMERMFAETEGKADGLLVLGHISPIALQRWREKYRGVVCISRGSVGGVADEVYCDGHKAAGLAVSHLIGLGHRQIAYIGPCRNEERYQGFLDVLRLHRIQTSEELVFETGRSETDGYEVMKDIVRLDHYPTGIYCASDIIAVGILKYLNRQSGHYFSPSIIATDDIEECQRTKPLLSTVRISKEDMASHAMYLLLSRLGGSHRACTRIEILPELVERSSCSRAGESGWMDYVI